MKTIKLKIKKIQIKKIHKLVTLSLFQMFLSSSGFVLLLKLQLYCRTTTVVF